MISPAKHVQATLRRQNDQKIQTRAAPVLVASECQPSIYQQFRNTNMTSRPARIVQNNLHQERISALDMRQPMTWLRCPVKIHDNTATIQENIILMASSYSSSDDGTVSESDLTSNRSSNKSNQNKKRRYSFCSSDIGKIEVLDGLSEQKDADSKSEQKHEEEK